MPYQAGMRLALFRSQHGLFVWYAYRNGYVVDYFQAGKEYAFIGQDDIAVYKQSQ